MPFDRIQDGSLEEVCTPWVLFLVIMLLSQKAGHHFTVDGNQLRLLSRRGWLVYLSKTVIHHNTILHCGPTSSNFLDQDQVINKSPLSQTVADEKFNRTIHRLSRLQGGPKKVSQRSLHITSSNTVRFSKFFHGHILLEICNKAVIKYPTSPQTCCHTTLWNIYVSKYS